MSCEQPVVKHTLFLGLSVVGFNCSVGFNEQVTEITVQLVLDPCTTDASTPKYYYDTTLTEQTTTEADPGFMGEVLPIIGCPAYFRFGTFEFSGIIQSWEKEQSESANPGYTVKIVSPVKVLQNVNLIISEYTGPLTFNALFADMPTNLVNVYGFAESMNGVLAPQYYQSSPGVYEAGDGGIDGAVFGTAAGGFGGALVNDNGMKWSMMRNMLNISLAAVPRVVNSWTPHGRIIHKGTYITAYGAPWTNGYGLMPADNIVNFDYISEYFVDISEIPPLPDYLRFSGVSVSLMECISRVMQDAGYDYYLELIPMKNSISSSSGIDKIIKIRAISRLAQPQFGQIENYIQDREDDGTLVSSSFGRELRDDITSTFMIGGPKQTVYQAYQSLDPDNDGQPTIPETDDMIVPFFGTDISGNMLRVRKDVSGYWEFEADVSNINLSLEVMNFSGVQYIVINERELTQSKTFEAWTAHIETEQTDTYYAYSGGLTAPIISRNQVAQLRLNLSGSQISARDYVVWDNVAAHLNEQFDQSVEKDEKRLYEWVSTFANEYYGKKFAVRIPFTAALQDEESLQIKFSEEPSNDGGWTEVEDVVGLPHPTFYTDFFKNEQNKIPPIVAFEDADLLNTADLSQEDYLTYNNILYLKASVDESYVFYDRNTLTLPRIVVTLPSIIYVKDDELNLSETIHGIFQHEPTGRMAQLRREFQNVGSAGMFTEYGNLTSIPAACAIPIKSNVNNYGPWVSVGPAGGMKVEKNDGLVPWEYGNYATLNFAGQALADAGLTNMQVGEMGSITVAGYPDLPIGSEINSAGALAGKQLVENRTPTFGNFNGSNINGSPFNYQFMNFDFGVTWGGNYGPNVTNIQVGGGNAITTSYSLRTYTPAFGRFADLNAQRLRQIGQNRMRFERDLRAYIERQNLNQNKHGNTFSSREIGKSIATKSKNVKKALKGGSPHELLIGQNLSWNRTGESGHSRSVIGSFSLLEGTTELGSGSYSEKSIMSWDGLIRPFSTDGGNGLSRYYNLTSTGSGTVNSASITYILNLSGNITGITSSTTSVKTLYDLNPFANPAGYAWSHLATKHTGTAGHDIDMLARGTGIPRDGLILRHKNTGTQFDYRDSYRPLALRGPIVVSSWGYDLNGKPVPNAVDTTGSISSGIYQSTGLSDNFLTDWLVQPQTWPSAPIDLRLDRSRGVWTVPTNEQFANGRLLGHLGPFGSMGFRVLSSGADFRDISGNITGYSMISGWNPTQNLYASGCNLRWKYNESSGQWHVAGDSELAVLITGVVSGATWNRNVTGLTPYPFQCNLWSIHPSGSGLFTYTTGIMVTGWNMYTEGLTPTSTTAYIGKLVNGWLDNVDCRSITIR